MRSVPNHFFRICEDEEVGGSQEGRKRMECVQSIGMIKMTKKFRKAYTRTGTSVWG